MSGVYARPSTIAVVATPDALYLGELPRGPVHVLNGTAALIWEHAVGRTPHQTIASVAEAAGVDADAVRPDVERFLAELEQRRFLDLRDS